MQAERLEPKWQPTSDADKQAVQEQLDRLLLDPQFVNSKRYPSFLRFVVTQALQGESESLKERVLGVEVFGRSPDYDSTQDPIVRVTAAEIRKRILKYYDDPAHRDEIRLLLPSGTYVPVFEFPAAHTEETEALPGLEAATGSVEKEALPARGVPTETSDAKLPLAAAFSRTPSSSGGDTYKHASTSSRWIVAVALLAVVAAGAGFFAWRMHQPTPLDAFWAPIMDSNKPVLFCIADESGFPKSMAMSTNEPGSGPKAISSPTLVSAEDTAPLLDMVSLLRPKTHSFQILVQDKTNFTDLSHGSNIFIGAFDNKWTIFATNPLRFHFVSDADYTHLWIEDRQNPTRRDWTVNKDTPLDGVHKDYAIVARFTDTNTSQPTVVIAGLGHNGTAAAGNLALSPQSLAELNHLATKGWQSRNLEMVIETTVINGHPGVAHIDAAHTW